MVEGQDQNGLSCSVVSSVRWDVVRRPVGLAEPLTCCEGFPGWSVGGHWRGMTVFYPSGVDGGMTKREWR